MAGDATQVHLWADADVYYAVTGTTEPTTVTAAWAAPWKLVGLLDGEEGFTEAREEETTEKFAWGSRLVKKTHSKHKRTFKFVALEDNTNTFAIVNPGSPARTGTIGNSSVQTSSVKTPKYTEVAIGLETREGATVRRRLIKRADIEMTGEVKDSESDVSVYEFTVTIVPETTGVLYTDLVGFDQAGS